jgi:hypothetical protein
MIDALSIIWPFVDGVDPLFGIQMVRRWPDGVFDRLLQHGLLRQVANASELACPDCRNGHVESVVAVETPRDGIRFYIPCPVNLRVQVPPDALQQWTIDFDRLAILVAAAADAKGQVTTLSSGQLWRLGKVQWQSSKREALFALGLAGPNVAALAEQISRHGRAVVFVANRVPKADIWKNRRPAIVPLSQVATLCDSGIQIDLVGMAATVADSDSAAALAEAESLDKCTLNQMIRRQVKAEEKSNLTDDILIAAVQQHGSTRKAAEFLTNQAGQRVTKDKVHRAVQRAGGPQAVMNTEDSDSVQRPVASHSRDRHGKILKKAKATKEE